MDMNSLQIISINYLYNYVDQLIIIAIHILSQSDAPKKMNKTYQVHCLSHLLRPVRPGLRKAHEAGHARTAP
jgi:hypothetical protein